MRTAAPFLLASILLLAGCQSAPPADSTENPADQSPAKRIVHAYAFPPDQYPAVHAAAVEVLRDHGYRIARNDYRFGIITTYPKEAATIREFWIDDATTRDQRRSDTLNAQQRIVTVGISDFDLDTALRSTTSAGRPEGEEPVPTFYLTVKVELQRLQRPDRYLTHSASPRITRTYTDTPLHLKDRNIPGPYAQPLGFDRQLEHRLLQAIQDAAQQ